MKVGSPVWDPSQKSFLAEDFDDAKWNYILQNNMHKKRIANHIVTCQAHPVLVKKANQMCGSFLF